MNITNILKNLLIKDNFVIIPDFGAFVAKYQTAKIDKETNTISPPSYEITFDSKLNNDSDAILEKELVKSYSLTNDKAKTEIKKFTTDLQKKLAATETIQLEEIGTISKDSLGNIIFLPEKEKQLKFETYGLETIQLKKISIPEIKSVTSTPTVQTKITPKIETKPTNPVTKKSSKQTNSSKNNSGKIIIITLLSLAAIALIVFLILNSKQENIKEDGILTEMQTPLKEIIDTIIEETPPPINPEASNFYIVAGSFMDSKKADRFLQKQINEGYNATIMPGENGFFRIILLTFNNKEKAIEELTKIRESGKDVWLLSL